MILTATSRDFVDAVIPELMDWCEWNYPDLSQSWKAEQMGPPVTNPIGCNVKWDQKEQHWMPADACDLV